MASIDVSTALGATSALGTVESLIDTAIDASAAFGSVEGRISTQADFISKLTDSLKSGIGAMVDADMEEASARLSGVAGSATVGCTVSVDRQPGTADTVVAFPVT